MKMNLPNKLTLLRVILVPFFVGFLLLESNVPWFKWIALGIFIVASLTDMLDGKIARKYNLVTNFGKFMDPLADKLLVSAALVCLTALNKIPAWITIVIISREFVISGFRLIAAEQGSVIAASWWGKWKTAVTMITIVDLLIVVNGHGFVFDVTNSAGNPYFVLLEVIGTILLYISLVLTVISLLDYLVKNKDVMKEG